MFFIFTVLLGNLSAQSNSDEYNLLKSYSPPENAVQFSALVQIDDIWLQNGVPFTGLAFERHPNRQLLRLMSLSRGMQHGPTYLWYPDGSPQMSANYRRGKLHGRFLGWYHNGGIIYDMVINQGGYAGDYIEDDGSRALETGPDNDPEGTEQEFDKE